MTPLCRRFRELRVQMELVIELRARLDQEQERLLTMLTPLTNQTQLKNNASPHDGCRSSIDDDRSELSSPSPSEDCARPTSSVLWSPFLSADNSGQSMVDRLLLAKRREDDDEDEQSQTLSTRTSTPSVFYPLQIKKQEQKHNNNDTVENADDARSWTAGMREGVQAGWSVPARLNSLLAWRQFGSETSLTARSSRPTSPAQHDPTATFTHHLQQLRQGASPRPGSTCFGSQSAATPPSGDSSFFVAAAAGHRAINFLPHPFASFLGTAPHFTTAGAEQNARSLNLTICGTEAPESDAILTVSQPSSRRDGEFFISGKNRSNIGANPGGKQQPLLLHQPKGLSSDLSTMRQFRHTTSRPPFTYVSLIRQVRGGVYSMNGGTKFKYFVCGL